MNQGFRAEPQNVICVNLRNLRILNLFFFNLWMLFSRVHSCPFAVNCDKWIARWVSKILRTAALLILAWE